MKFGYIGLFFTVLTFASAFADPNPYKIVTSKAYVDTKQTKVPAGTNGALVTHSGTEGTFGTPRAVATSLGSDSTATSVPTSGAVVSKFNTNFPVQHTGGNVVGSVVTLTSTAGTTSATDIVSTVTSGGTYIPTDGAVYAAAATKVGKPTCTTTKPGDSSVCYGWTFTGVDAGGTQCLTANSACDPNNNQCCDGLTCNVTKGSGYVCTTAAGTKQ